MAIDIEAYARAMPSHERVAYLQYNGWHRATARGSQTWFAPGWKLLGRRSAEPPEHDRTFYSLACAIRKALTQAAEEARPPFEVVRLGRNELHRTHANRG